LPEKVVWCVQRKFFLVQLEKQVLFFFFLVVLIFLFSLSSLLFFFSTFFPSSSLLPFLLPVCFFSFSYFVVFFVIF